MAIRYTGPLPPRLAPVPSRRRALRPWFWALLMAVLFLRFVVLREQTQWIGNLGPVFHENRGRRHPQTQVQPPEREVPKDLWRLNITVSERDANVLRGYNWSWNRRQGRHHEDRPEVAATVMDDGGSYSNVALHLKGSAGSFRPFDDKPALTLSFSKHVQGQKFHGYSKLSLNNSVQDDSYLCEAICRELFNEAGVPTPGADHVTVILNGRDLGLYVLTEGWGKPFLRRHFKEVGGNLYDGGFVQDLTGALDTNSGDQQDDHSDIDRLLAATLEPDPASRWQRLNQVLDMDRFISFLAMEVITCHWDGYSMNRNNYRVFHNRETGRMIFMPHGMDQMFGTFRSSPDSTILPQMQGMVARAVVTHPEGRQLYLDRIAALRTNVFIPEKVTARVRELSARIRPTLAAYSERTARYHDSQVQYLCQRITRRAESISEQLIALPKPLEFDTSGSAELAGWNPRITSREGGMPRLERSATDGRDAFHIEMNEGSGVASWRSRVMVEPGRYRFSARARTQDVGPGSGVCLRVSGGRNDSLTRDEAQWRPVEFEFEVTDTLTEVELVAEFRASGGHAWFDASSLRLQRL